jgi:hypothetical protein
MFAKPRDEYCADCYRMQEKIIYKTKTYEPINLDQINLLLYEEELNEKLYLLALSKVRKG